MTRTHRPRLVIACEVMHPPFDEGIRIYASSLTLALAAGHDLLLLAERDGDLGGHPVRGLLTDRWFRSPRLAAAIHDFDPDAVLYIPWTSLTARSLLRIGALRRAAPHARIGVAALQPRRAGLLERAAALAARPHVVLTAGPGASRQARSLRIPVVPVGAGVDLERFRPPEPGEREALRRRAGIDTDAFTVLHVGHVKRSRNVEALVRIARLERVICLLVGSSSTVSDAALTDRLSGAGIQVMSHHQDRIELAYRLADAYLFPVISHLDAIETPLSVLEAAATDLTIVSTPFGGLPDLLGAGSESVVWTADVDEMISGIRRLAGRARGGGSGPGTRRLVSDRGWSQLAASVETALRGEA